MSRTAFQAKYRGEKITVYISADYALWHWVDGDGQRIIPCDPRVWIEQHGIPSAATERAQLIVARFKPPTAPKNLNIANQTKSTPQERKESSMIRKYGHEG